MEKTTIPLGTVVLSISPTQKHQWYQHIRRYHCLQLWISELQASFFYCTALSVNREIHLVENFRVWKWSCSTNKEIHQKIGSEDKSTFAIWKVSRWGWLTNENQQRYHPQSTCHCDPLCSNKHPKYRNSLGALQISSCSWICSNKRMICSKSITEKDRGDGFNYRSYFASGFWWEVLKNILKAALIKALGVCVS